ncbi:MAG: hypothetical protein QOF98_168 [Streptomyces sp.]|nr:hypothetical protein [Streptomyces sp.]
MPCVYTDLRRKGARTTDGGRPYGRGWEAGKSRWSKPKQLKQAGQEAVAGSLAFVSGCAADAWAADGCAGGATGLASAAREGRAAS